MLCIKIFFVRIIDVSLGTIRTVFTVKGKNLAASIIGFVEVFIWFIIVKDALNSMNNSIFIALSYALGFSTGTYVGGILANFFTKHSTISVQIVISKENEKLIDVLHNNGYALSVVNVKGYKDNNRLLIFMEIQAFRLSNLRKIVNTIDPKAFIVVNDSKAVYNGYFSSNLK